MINKFVSDLNNIYLDLKFENEELYIDHSLCPVFPLLHGVCCSLLDFPEGIVRYNGELTKFINIGVWNDDLNDFSYHISRKDFGVFDIICDEEALLDLPRGKIMRAKKSIISKTTLEDLAKKIKKVLEDYLIKIERFDIISVLNAHNFWLLKFPSSVSEFLEWKQRDLW